MVCVGKNLKDYPVPNPLPVDQVAQSGSIQSETTAIGKELKHISQRVSWDTLGPARTFLRSVRSMKLQKELMGLCPYFLQHW